jgi:hypothetical protein
MDILAENSSEVDRILSRYDDYMEEVLDIVKTNHYNKNEIDTKLNVKSDKSYVDGKFDQILGEGASSTLDTIGEISNAIQEHNDEYDSLLAVVGNKLDKTTYENHIKDYNSVVSSVNNIGQSLSNKANKSEIPTKLSQLDQDIEFGVNEEEVLDIIKDNSEQVDMLSIGTSDSYDVDSDTEIPTSKAVKEMIGSSGGDSNEIDEILNIEYADYSPGIFDVYLSISDSEIDFTKPIRINLYDSEASRDSELQNRNGNCSSYLTIYILGGSLNISGVVEGYVYNLNPLIDACSVDTLQKYLEMQIIVSPEYYDDYQNAGSIFSKEKGLLRYASIHGTKRNYNTPLLYFEI